MSDNGHITWTNSTRRLGELIPWEHNPREINTREAERLGDSLVEFGQIQTIAIGPDGEVYDGHQRKAVWSLLPQFGPDHEVDVRVSSRALTEQERQKLVVYLHRGTMGNWDWDELANSFEVPDLLEWGFEESELQLDWGNDDPTPDPGAQVDKAAELQEKWQVERGQVWQAGRHRVMCGDSTCAEDVARLMGGERAAMLLVDPPYGMDLDTDYSKIKGTDKSPNALGYAYASVVGDDRPFDRASVPMEASEEFWFGADYYRDTIPVGGSWFVWEKRRENDAEMIGNDFELIWSKQSHKRRMLRYRWVGWAATEQGERRAHPTQKPVGLLSVFVGDFSKPDDIIGDPFTGSGTAVVACEQLGRMCRASEIEPKYVAVTLERLTGMGLEAVLVDD